MPLGDLEIQVVSIGLSPGEPAQILSGHPRSFLQRFRQRFFGYSPGRPLADKRLEALRALAAAIRDSPGSPDPAMITAALAAGWSATEIADVQAMGVTAAPPRTVRAPARAIALSETLLRA